MQDSMTSGQDVAVDDSGRDTAGGDLMTLDPSSGSCYEPFLADEPLVDG